MDALRLFLFGTPRVERAGAALNPGRAKSYALLAYLAATAQPHEREHLAALLWPELDADGARNGLRRELSLLRSLLGAELFVADRRYVAIAPGAPLWLDVADFAARVARAEAHGHQGGELCADCAAALAEAVALYAADFMAGLTLPDCPVFDEWQFFQREALRARLAQALQWLGAWHRGRGEHEPASAYARRWLQLDPLHEPAHRELMRLYAEAGRHAAALRQYRECARLLEAELGVEPDAETSALAEAIQARRLAPPPAAPPPSLPAPPAEPPPSLPAPATPLVGREQELESLGGYLARPHARLITLVGPGGIGKTRLAIELAARHAPAFADGAAFAALQPIASPELLVGAVADAVGCRLSGAEAPRVQLLSHLRDKALLLVLDNFEHLLAGAELLGELLAAAPGLRLLVTSREVLNLQEEWSYPLDGLAFPPEVATADAEGYAAVRLFAERARRARPGFALAETGGAVARICRLVEGMPLAIELAAAWSSALDCGMIAAEIERSLAFLVARQRNLPERHRSMRAVFDSSWALLAPEERSVFMALAVFRGGFSGEAAARVAGASPAILAALSDKSLLRLERGGRYQVHELLRQYAEERLEAAPDDAARARQAHSDYFLDFLVERDEAVSTGRDVVRTAEIAVELENVRLAWHHAVAAGAAERIGRGINTLANFYLYRGPYDEGIAACEQVARALRAAPPGEIRDRLLAEALHEQAWLYLNVGRIAEARAGLEATSAIYTGLGILPPPNGRASDPRAGLAFAALLEGDYAAAARLSEEYLRLSEREGYATQRPFAWYLLGRTALAQGLYARARYAAEQAYAAVRADQDRWFEAYVLVDLGKIALGQGEHAEARRHLRASYAIREAFDDPEGKALALAYEGSVALSQGAAEEARDLFARSLAIYRTRGDRRGLAEAHLGHGLASCALDDVAAAARHFRDALALARDVRLVPLTLAALVGVSELLLRRGRAGEASELLVLALRHPATDRETSDQAHALLLAYEQQLAAGSAGAAEPAPLDDVVAHLLVELAGLEAVGAASEPAL
ncbi:MAG TPA: BTAD domain-containing putative transcriptional regulator [Chloroflexaceae bacterium]|nr:BTAD domain-containing putative transcriptional regulator [Chloroflexaceae bacterium]